MSTRVLLALLVGCTAMLSSACGEDDAPQADPEQRCRDFVDAWCNKNTECARPTDRARVKEDCRFFLGVDIDCREVKEVSASYSSCIQDITRTPCVPPSAVPFPETCRGVLLR